MKLRLSEFGVKCDTSFPSDAVGAPVPSPEELNQCDGALQGGGTASPSETTA